MIAPSSSSAGPTEPRSALFSRRPGWFSSRNGALWQSRRRISGFLGRLTSLGKEIHHAWRHPLGVGQMHMVTALDLDSCHIGDHVQPHIHLLFGDRPTRGRTYRKDRAVDNREESEHLVFGETPSRSGLQPWVEGENSHDDNRNQPKETSENRNPNRNDDSRN